MSNRIYDSSQLIKRRGEQAIAGSFLTRMRSPNNLQGSPPILGIKDSSIMNSVKTGSMTEWTRYPTCYGISPGCPCPELNASIVAGTGLSMPGAVTGITFTVGSIIVSWNAPTEGTGPFNYRVTPYLNGVEQPSVFTGSLSYRFTGLQEWQPYTFTVSATNTAGQGPTVPSTSYFICPPDSLSTVMSGSSTVVDPVPSLKYIINVGLDAVLTYIASVNLGPTKGSRFAYIWVVSAVGAWNWVRTENHISGIHDNWNWTTNKGSGGALSDNDALIWMCSVIDYVSNMMIPGGYTSIYNCPADVITRVKSAGGWNQWMSAWQTWYDGRASDGSVTAGTTQPTDSTNWAQTIVVDGATVNNISGFAQPQQWTRLTIQGKKQGYLTYNWDDVTSTCLTESNEASIQASVSPKTGIERDEEINSVMTIAAGLTDQQKITAEFWAGGPGTVSPPLMFIWLWKEYIKSLSSISCANIMFSLLDLAIHLFEGGRVTWRLKKTYMEDRPIQEVRRRFTGQSVLSWNGTVDGAQWLPYQANNFVTPPFADFPSGHSHFSKAFALTMNKWFGSNIIKHNIFYDKQNLICPLFPTSLNGTFGDFSITPGMSEIQPGIVPATPMNISFNTWDDMAESAGISRLYGGIHCLAAHTGSQSVAVQVDALINSTWAIQVS